MVKGKGMGWRRADGIGMEKGRWDRCGEVQMG